jgi:hypothetical protein
MLPVGGHRCNHCPVRASDPDDSEHDLHSTLEAIPVQLRTIDRIRRPQDGGSCSLPTVTPFGAGERASRDRHGGEILTSSEADAR